MGWRDEYQQASFRGVPFFVRRARTEFGRRTQLHVFPNRDTPESEDLGRKPRRYGVEGYLLGDDFYTQKDTFLRAVEAHGPGLLVHPYYGQILVACKRCSITDTDRELRITRMDLDFEEAGEELEPSAVANPKSTADSVKKSGLAAVNNAFLRAYTIVNKPLAEVNKLVSAVEQGADLINTARRSVANVASFQREILDIGNSVTALINNATDLATDTLSVLTFGTFPFDGEVRVTTEDAKQMYDEMVTLFDGTDEEPTDDESPVKAYNDLLEQSAAITAGGLIPEVEFDSLDALLASAEAVYNKIDALEEAGIDDNDLLEAFRETRAAIRADIEARQDRLSRLSETVLPDSLPAIVLSNSLYGNIDQEQDILRRNGLDHPGFVPGHQPIQVLINV
jgi:prophage DNA circulation protein